MVDEAHLASEDRTETRARSLLTLINRAAVSTALPALPYFASVGANILAEIVQCTRRGIGGRSFDEVAGGTAAVETWAKSEQGCSQQTLPPELIAQVVSAIAARQRTGLAALLQCAHQLVALRRVSAEDELRLIDALGDLIIDRDTMRSIRAA